MTNIIDYFTSYADLSSKIYWLLYEGAPQIVYWFINPLSETTNDPLVTELLGNYSPLELTFGVGIISALVLGIVKFFTNMFPI